MSYCCHVHAGTTGLYIGTWGGGVDFYVLATGFANLSALDFICLLCVYVSL